MSAPTLSESIRRLRLHFPNNLDVRAVCDAAEVAQRDAQIADTCLQYTESRLNELRLSPTAALNLLADQQAQMPVSGHVANIKAETLNGEKWQPPATNLD